MDRSTLRTPNTLPAIAAVLLLGLLIGTWLGRVFYPYDLEWMEGGMLAHSWRLQQGLGLYTEPTPTWIPFVYPPGYASVVALFGSVSGLSLPLGRLVGLSGAVASACALGWIVWRHSGDRAMALFGGVAFLGTYAASGAFFDLVRPDALSMAFLSWSLAIGLERHRRAPMVAGLLLCAAFLMKHNTAAFGVPMLLGIWVRSGWKPAFQFGWVAAVPAGLMTAWLQFSSDGHFLQYLIDVPSSHPRYWERVLPGMPRELGNALPVAMAFTAGWFVLRQAKTSRLLPSVAVVLPVWTGIGFSMWIDNYGNPAEGVYPFPAAFGAWALGAGATALLLNFTSRDQWRWRAVYGLGVASTALAVVALMRAHNGGYLNVYIPLHWVICLGFALAMTRLHQTDLPHPRRWAAVAMGAQMLWSAGTLDWAGLVPTDIDRGRGAAFVAATARVDGPVLSPFASWIPVQGGHDPGFHLIALWDLDFKKGPYYAQVGEIRHAIELGEYGAVLQGSKPMDYGVFGNYRTLEKIAPEGGLLAPKTGWDAGPVSILVPWSP